MSGTLTNNTNSALLPLDESIEVIRIAWKHLLPLYVMAMAPFSICIYLLIDAASSQDRSVLPVYSLLLVLATFWRWAGVAEMQRRVQHDLRGEQPLPVRKRLWAIILTRLYSFMALTIGSAIVLPSFYGFFMGTFAGPIYLESNGSAMKQAWDALCWIQNAAGKLVKVTLAISCFILLLVLAVLVTHFFLMDQVGSSILALDSSELKLTLGSTAWVLSCGYFIFLAFDFFWAIAGVTLFYNLQARRLGTDLRRRLKSLDREGG